MDKNMTLDQLARERPDLIEAAVERAIGSGLVLCEFTAGPRVGQRTYMTPKGAAKFADNVRVLPADEQPKPSALGRRAVSIGQASETADAKQN